MSVCGVDPYVDRNGTPCSGARGSLNISVSSSFLYHCWIHLRATDSQGGNKNSNWYSWVEFRPSGFQQAIKLVCKKYQREGQVRLINSGWSQWYLHLAPTWTSCKRCWVGMDRGNCTDLKASGKKSEDKFGGFDVELWMITQILFSQQGGTVGYSSGSKVDQYRTYICLNLDQRQTSEIQLWGTTKPWGIPVALIDTINVYIYLLIQRGSATI